MAKLDERTREDMERELEKEVKGMRTRERVALLSCCADYLLDYKDPQKSEKEHIGSEKYMR